MTPTNLQELLHILREYATMLSVRMPDLSNKIRQAVTLIERQSALPPDTVAMPRELTDDMIKAGVAEMEAHLGVGVIIDRDVVFLWRALRAALGEGS